MFGIASFSSTIRRNNSFGHSCTTRLNSLNFAQIDGLAAEAGRELRDIKGNALGRVDRAELVARGATNASISVADGLLEGTVLLDVVTVGAERVVSGSSITLAVVCGEIFGKRS